MYDVAVIGGGPAGYVAAIKAAQEGAKTVLFEKDVLGGTCLNRGCIPTKTYVKTAEVIDSAKAASERGVNFADLNFSVDMKKAVESKNKVVKTLTSGVGALLKSNGVDVFYGDAKIKADRKIACGDAVYEAKDIIIASGSSTFKPPIPGIDSKYCITSDEILDIDFVPEKLVVVGGGVIGLELSMTFASFGSDVTIVELAPRVVPNLDEDVSAEVAKHAAAKGIKVLTGVKVESFEEKGEKVFVNVSTGEKLEADIALISIGRMPVVGDICEMKLEMNRRFIKTDDFLETSQPGIYAIGDCNGKLMLAHAGSKMGEVAVHNIMHGKKRLDLESIPSCVYTSPEIGCVGLTEAAAKEKGEFNKGVFPFSANGRALASGEATGFVKLLSDKETGRILGCHIVGPGACEIINEVACLMEAEVTVNELAETTHAHPTFSEAIMEAAGACLGKCVHMPARRKK